MSKVYFGSDYHFYHQNILKYQPKDRPFNSIEEMNDEIIKRHNSVIKSTDFFFSI